MPESSSSIHDEVSPSESEPQEEAQLEFTKEAENIAVTVKFDQPEYDLDSVIGTTVEIKNTGAQSILYVKGSGSNIAPDALSYQLNNFAGLFYPAMMTMDYRVEVINPGETLKLDLNFAPYTAKDETKAFGTDKEIEFFKSEDFTPANPGPVEGKAVFTFYLKAEDADPDTFLDIDNLEPLTIEVDINTRIVG